MSAQSGEQHLELQLLRLMFNAGQDWLKSLKASSWAKQCYVGGRSALPLYDNEIKLAHTVRDAKAEDPPAEFLVLPADPGSAKEKHPTVTLMRVLPSTGATGDVPRHLNFHVCCHMRNDAGNDHVIAWRIEGPEGLGTDHNFCHMQPLRKIGEFTDGCFPAWMPTRFPTFPMAANSSLEAAIAACLTSSGKSALVRAVSADVALRSVVETYLKRIEVRT